MYVVIFYGKHLNSMAEMGVNIFTEAIGEVSYRDYIIKIVKNKRFPGWPTYTHNGIDIECMCEWTENGSVTSDILRKIFVTLDTLKIFNRSTGITPVLLLDDHGSRFQIPFLQYINNPDHLWAAIIGVPYGILLIEITYIMLMINYAWKLSFSRVNTNKAAIAERGWFHLNLNLLNNTQLRSTMTTA